MGFRDGYDRFDRHQRRSRWLGFVLAARQKYKARRQGQVVDVRIPSDADAPTTREAESRERI